MQALLNDPSFLLVIAAAFVAIAGVGWVLTPDPSQQRSRKRVENFASRASIRSKRQTSAIDQASQRRKQVQETLKDLEEKQKRARKKAVTLKAKLQQAGLSITPQTFWLICLALGVGAAGAALFYGQSPIIAGCAAIAVGLGLPQWVLGFLRGRRMKKFTAEFANAIDIVVRGVKSGLPLNECLKIIARESPEPLGSEFAQLVENETVGVSLDEGLRKMYERMPLQELNFFGVVLTIQSKTGGNLAEALSNLSGVLRSRKLMYEKIAALSGEAKASALIIGCLPPGVMGIVYATTPTYMNLLFTEPLGQMMLLGGAMWMGTGIFIMKRMISFKV